jgi:P27 family predicted phage terminase small subunit
MGARGPAPKPRLQVIREGNPGKQKLRDGVKLPPAQSMAEPDWSSLLPGEDVAQARASEEWRRVVPVLIRSSGLADIDRAVVLDYCVTVVRLEQCERRISAEGLIVEGQRGPCRNPLTTVAAQYRTQLKTYVGELGLSPSARGRLDTPGAGGDGDDDDPFD